MDTSLSSSCSLSFLFSFLPYCVIDMKGIAPSVLFQFSLITREFFSLDIIRSMTKEECVSKLTCRLPSDLPRSPSSAISLIPHDFSLAKGAECEACSGEERPSAFWEKATWIAPTSLDNRQVCAPHVV